MNRDRRSTGRPNGRFAAALVSSAFAIALSGAALAGPGMEDHPHDNKGKDGGCSACGSGGGNDAAIQDASRTAGEKSRNAGNEGGTGITSVSGGQGGSEALGGAITQLGQTLDEQHQQKMAELDRQLETIKAQKAAASQVGGVIEPLNEMADHLGLQGEDKMRFMQGMIDLLAKQKAEAAAAQLAEEERKKRKTDEDMMGFLDKVTKKGQGKSDLQIVGEAAVDKVKGLIPPSWGSTAPPRPATTPPQGPTPPSVMMSPPPAFNSPPPLLGDTHVSPTAVPPKQPSWVELPPDPSKASPPAPASASSLGPPPAASEPKPAAEPTPSANTTLAASEPKPAAEPTPSAEPPAAAATPPARPRPQSEDPELDNMINQDEARKGAYGAR